MSGQNTIYEMVTEQVIKQLEAGTVPWRQPWTVSPRQGTASLPYNGASGRPYRGVNVFLLIAAGYTSPCWLTFRQIKEHGGQVRKGEHGTIVVFWKIRKIEAERDGQKCTDTVPLLRYYRVWNLEQVDGVTLPQRVQAEADAAPAEQPEPDEAAEAIIAGYTDGPATSHDGGSSAFYRPGDDTIHLPVRESFNAVDGYYTTRFHEMGHSTGHRSRLDRFKGSDQHTFGSHGYGREELVAEMTAAFLSAEAGLLPATVENTSSYIASWLRTIKEDRRAVVVAAGAAQRAADLILGRVMAGSGAGQTD